jgi:phosphoribosylpyrophosphate synthetase
MRGAFAVARAAEVTGREIVVVDDIYTTGTTATECARVLRKAGAARVWVARTLKLASKNVDFDASEGVEESFKVSEFQGFKGQD